MVNDGSCVFHCIKEDLKLLERIESLKFSGLYWAAHGAPPRRGFMSSLATVVELVLDSASFGDMDHTFLIICAFPSLRRLSLPSIPVPNHIRRENNWIFEPYPAYAPPKWMSDKELVRPAPLSALSISAEAMMAVFNWLNWAGSCRLTHLGLDLPSTIRSHNTPPLKQFLLTSCTTLEHLRLTSAAKYPGSLTDLFDLSSYHHLRTLYFDNLEEDPLNKTLVAIIQSTSSPLLERVRFTFDQWRVASDISWSGLDPFLSESDIFPNLKSIRFSLSGMHDILNTNDLIDFAKYFKQSLPLLHALGLLQIQVPTESVTRELQDVIDAENLIDL
jgi:hypothetical protein